MGDRDNMKSDKQKTLHRIKIIEGHLSAIEKMIENDEYCISVIHQSLAVQKALKKLDMEVMRDHIKYCVIEQARNGDAQKVTDELLKIYDYK